MPATTTANLSPSDFIRSMPNATSAQVMAAGQKAGVKFSRALIYMVRTKRAKAASKAAGAKPATAPKAATAKASAKTAPAKTGFSKGAFILSMPAASAADVVKAASAAGLKTDEKYVRWVRWNAGKAAAKGLTQKAKVKPAAPKKTGKAKSPAAPVKAPAAAEKAKAAKAAKPTVPQSQGAVGKTRQGAKSDEESSFLRSAMRLGLNRAMGLLRDLDAALVPFFGNERG